MASGNCMHRACWMLIFLVQWLYISTAKECRTEKESKRNSDQVNTLTDKIASLEEDNDKLLEDFGHASFEAYWYETNVAICTPTGKKYHSYDCSHWKDSDYVYIFSIADAESRGYEPCSDCQ